jgi:uncharacterized damage-inducible protein DinB
MQSFLRYFDSVNRRAMRDVSVLPEAAESWKPPAGQNENAWSIPEIVGHMAVSRLYFISAYSGEGWITDPWPTDFVKKESWAPVLERSAAEVQTKLGATPPEWLHRRVELIGDSDKTISGWRILMMMVEHDVHHRSQIDTYAGLNGWDVAQIFDRTAEWVASQQPEQRNKHAG